MEAKLHFITSKLNYKYIDTLNTLKETGRLTTQEYINFIEEMEYILDSLASGLTLKQQQDLKLQFKHVDDSLFALSLRNP